MFKKLVLKGDSFILSVGTILYGLQLLIHPRILTTYEVYQILNGMFDERIISILFIALGLLKIIGLVYDLKKIKRISLSLMAGLWLIFSVTFILSEPPNTIWLLSLMMALFSVNIAVREVL